MPGQEEFINALNKAVKSNEENIQSNKSHAKVLFDHEQTTQEYIALVKRNNELTEAMCRIFEGYLKTNASSDLTGNMALTLLKGLFGK